MQSEHGTGSTFTVEIPQRYVAETPDTVRGSVIPLAEQSFLAPQGRILVIDDNAGNLNVIKSLLARTLLQVDTALSGRQGIELARQKEYHVILLDYMMPQPDGIETLRELRRLNCRSPVVALTADVTAGTRQRLLGEGFTGYLSKPVPWPKLEQTLLSFLPENLVTRITLDGGPECSAVAGALQQRLEQYDISLEAGLTFLSRSLSQYKTVSGLFHTHTHHTSDLLARLAAAGDLPGIAHAAHSLKTLTLMIGAEELSAITRRVEQKCLRGETEYIRAVMPLLLYELANVRQGIDRNLLGEKTASTETSPSSLPAGMSLPDLISQTAAHIADYHCAESRQTLSVLIALERKPEARRLLERTRNAVDDLNFEDAETLFRQFCKKRIKEKSNLEFLQ